MQYLSSLVPLQEPIVFLFFLVDQLGDFSIAVCVLEVVAAGILLLNAVQILFLGADLIAEILVGTAALENAGVEVAALVSLVEIARNLVIFFELFVGGLFGPRLFFGIL